MAKSVATLASIFLLTGCVGLPDVVVTDECELTIPDELLESVGDMPTVPSDVKTGQDLAQWIKEQIDYGENCKAILESVSKYVQEATQG